MSTNHFTNLLNANFYPYSVNTIISHCTPISQIHYITVIKPSTNEPTINLDESEEETEEETQFTTTWGE